MTNPLLEMQGLPAFSQIKPDHIEPAIDELLALNRKTIAELLQSNPQPDWLSVIEPIEELDDRLSRAWSPVSHMNSVVNSDKLRDAYNACLPKLSEYGTEMGQNKALYKA
ncbi:MAG: oligopeptidase A, partial [Gammaproteobacteria bacterium]|nr:oligopeptidase A [Gammaproteobacteria bacterium]